MYIAETTYGTTPTSGTWNHVFLASKIDPRKIFERKPTVGLGVQIPSDWVKTKEKAEFAITHDLIAKSASPAFEWTDFYKFICGESMNLSVENHMKSFSLGAKLDLATDRFWTFKGCKIKSYEVSGKAADKIIGSVNILAQKAEHGTTDYVGGTATRASVPSKTPILFSDCDVKYGAAGSEASIVDRVEDFTFTFSRDVEQQGSASADKTLYRGIEEKTRELTVDVTVSLNSFTEYDDFIANAQRNVILEIPAGTGGRRFTLGSGRILNAPVPVSELDLLAVKVSLTFATLTIAAI